MSAITDPKKPPAEFRNIGIHWRERIPKDWGVLPLRRVIFRVSTGRTPPLTNADYFTDGQLNWFTPGDFSTGIELHESARKVTSEAIEDGVCPLFPRGTVFLVGIGATLGKVAVSTTIGSANQQINAILPDKHTDPYFIAYFLDGFRTEVRVTSNGNTLGILNQDGTKSLVVPVPPLDTQQQIARFLDEKTARIDGLIEKKRALLERLAEKRQALITRAVTKGLNPDAPLKPSGIDWLGDIPAHWLTIRLGYVSVIGNGSTPSRDNPEYWEAGTYPWLNSSVVNLESVQVASDFVTPKALKQCHLPIVTPPAVLIGITGQGKTRGMATILQAEATINQHIAYVKPEPSVLDTHFLRRVLNSAYAHLRSESDGAGSTKGAITCEQIKSLGVQCPPITEQREIVAFVEKYVHRLRDIETSVLRSVEALSEYRSAMITAAVTGQIPELR